MGGRKIIESRLSNVRGENRKTIETSTMKHFSCTKNCYRIFYTHTHTHFSATLRSSYGFFQGGGGKMPRAWLASEDTVWRFFFLLHLSSYNQRVSLINLLVIWFLFLSSLFDFTKKKVSSFKFMCFFDFKAIINSVSYYFHLVPS